MPGPKSELKAQLLEVEMDNAREIFESEFETEPASDVQREGASRGKARFHENGGYQALYNTQTGDVSYPPVSMLANKIIREVDEDTGKRLWQLDPVKGRKYTNDTRSGRKMLVRPEGDHYCPMHKESPERATMDAIGFAGIFCKSNKRLRDVQSKSRHFENKHPGAYKAYERWRVDERERRAEERENRMAAAMEALMAAQAQQAKEAV